MALDKVMKWRHNEFCILLVQNDILEKKLGFLGVPRNRSMKLALVDVKGILVQTLVQDELAEHYSRMWVG